MSRPLMQHGVQQLREMFDHSKADAGVLGQLEQELRHRQVPRAAVLLAEVRAAMASASDAGVQGSVAPPVPQTALPRQADLWTRPLTQPLPVPSPAPATSPAPVPALAPTPATLPGFALPVRVLAATPTAARTAAPTPPPPRAVASMTVEDACKLLKTTPNATWESIEQTRRLLVQQSSPARISTMGLARRTQALEDAHRVNDATAVLSRARERGR